MTKIDSKTDQSGGRIILAGGNGFLGTSFAHHLAESGYEIVILSRRPEMKLGPFRYVYWDARSMGKWVSELDGATGLVNLTGRSVDCIKTPDHQDEILRSRVEATRVLGQAFRTIANPPPVWVQLSTAHIYGDPPEVVCSEDSPTGIGMAPFVGKAWEEEFHQGILAAQRGVVLRISFVIGRDRGAGGGALSRLKFVARLGLGGRIGSGKQGLSWIHERDMNRLIERGLFDSTMSGIYIATAPNPVSQVDFMRTLRKAIGMPIGLPATETMVRLGAKWILHTDPELALYGRYIVSTRLKEEGFVFQFPELREAIADLVRK